jgi:small subunit ribosomal protein S16
MAVKIRFCRGGAKKRPYYKLVVTDSRSPRDGKYIEKIGSYDPLQPENSDKKVIFDDIRLKHWLSVGAELSDSVKRRLKLS